MINSLEFLSKIFCIYLISFKSNIIPTQPTGYCVKEDGVSRMPRRSLYHPESFLNAVSVQVFAAKLNTQIYIYPFSFELSSVYFINNILLESSLAFSHLTRIGDLTLNMSITSFWVTRPMFNIKLCRSCQ